MEKSLQNDNTCTDKNLNDLKRIRFNEDPDYTKPAFEMPPGARERLLGRLEFLYGKEEALAILPELERVIKVHHAHKPDEMIELERIFDPKERFTEQDMVLITYGDLIHGEGGSPLSVLNNFVRRYNRGGLNTLHILPFFPYSSDRGFSVVDFRRVDPNLGTWDDIGNIGDCYDLMFDGVLNHCSSRSQMFREFLNGNPDFQDYFISYSSPDDLTPDQRSKIFRPRTSDILTRFETLDGPRYVWTTFSEDQVDMNFRNPKVLVSVINGLLFYVRQGADMLRLDAVTFIWAEPGTECVHLPETHEVVKLLRDVMELIAPSLAIVTETNVPHQDNISYFGNGRDEAHMVYNFALPPLVLHTFYTEDTTALSDWARGLTPPSELTTFFNMLDTHDGIGLMGVKEILSRDETEGIIQMAKKKGALISYKMTEAFTNEPYEINSTWWSAINGDHNEEDMTLQVKRYLASRSISLVLQGVPGIYAHGAIGSPNAHDLVEKSGHNRDVNRAPIHANTLADDFRDPRSKISLLRQYGSPLNIIRSRNRAFHPRGSQQVLLSEPQVFSLLRVSPEGDQHILTITHVTKQVRGVEIDLSEIPVEAKNWFDLISGQEWITDGHQLVVTLQPYAILWLIPASELGQTKGTADRK